MSARNRRGAVVLAAVLGATGARPVAAAPAEPAPVAAADDAPTVPVAEPTPTPTPARRALAIGAALVPGAMYRAPAAGSSASPNREPPGLDLRRRARRPRRRRRAAGRHLRLVAPGLTIPIIVAGGGAMFTSWFGDLWVAAERAGRRRRARRRAGASTSAPRGVSEPLRGGATYARAAGEVDLGPVALAPEVLWNVEGGEQRARLDVRRSLLGSPAADGSRLHLRAGAQLHRGLAAGVSTGTVELAVAGRLAGARLARALRGTFSDLELGGGVEVARYHDVDDTDASDLLLARVAWGVYLGTTAASSPGTTITAATPSPAGWWPGAPPASSAASASTPACR
ncbi:MAG: hypothetical protein R2939_05245 [Kofleriaceae bacterium]